MAALSSAQIAIIGKSTLDFHLKNKPIDQVAQDKPLLQALNKTKQAFAGAKEYIVETLRTNYGSNATWFSGSGQGTIGYNSRDSLAQAKYSWYQLHDGMEMSEAELRANGITVDDDGGAPSTVSEADRIQLVDLWQENTEVLRLGCQEKFDHALHLNGSGGADQMVGLDGLLPTVNNVGVVGGIDRATAGNAYWRHHAYLTLTTANMLKQMEKAWRECIRKGGERPNFILAGQDFIDAYVAATTTASAAGGIQRTITAGKGGTDMDGAVSGVFFKGVEIKWDPTFDDNVAGMDTPTVAWSKRCYFLNTNHIKLRPLKNDDFRSRAPKRDKGAYSIAVAILWRGTLTMNQSNCHAVLALA